MGEPYGVRTASQWESYHHHRYYFINLRGLNHAGSKVDNSIAREMAAKENGFHASHAPLLLKEMVSVSYYSHTILRGEGRAT